MAGGRASKHKVSIAERRAMAIDLRSRGDKTYDQIAEVIRAVKDDDGNPRWPKYSGAQAYRDVSAALKQKPAAERQRDESPDLSERRAMALELRKQGGSFRRIAEVMRAQVASEDDPTPRWSNYDEGMAYRDVVAELDKIKASMAESAEQVRTLELERLDDLWSSFYTKATNGDYFAFDRLMLIMDRRRRYVALDVPLPKQETDITSGGQPAPVVFYIPDNGRGDRTTIKEEGEG